MLIKPSCIVLILMKFANFASLKSLKTRRLVFDITFVHKIINGNIYCPKYFQNNWFESTIIQFQA